MIWHYSSVGNGYLEHVDVYLWRSVGVLLVKSKILLVAGGVECTRDRGKSGWFEEKMAQRDEERGENEREK